MTRVGFIYIYGQLGANSKGKANTLLPLGTSKSVNSESIW